MKKLLLLIGAIVLVFVSCNKDDDSGDKPLQINSQNLLGKWFIVGGTINSGSFVNYNHDCATNRDFQEFFVNGELTFNGYNTECELNEVETSLWALNENSLTVINTSSDPIIYEYDYEIESLTTNQLIIRQTITDTGGTSIQRTTFSRN